MPKPRNPNPPQNVHIMVPRELYDRIQLLLHSPAEGRIPLGGLSAFFVQAAESHLRRLIQLSKESKDAPQS